MANISNEDSIPKLYELETICVPNDIPPNNLSKSSIALLNALQKKPKKLNCFSKNWKCKKIEPLHMKFKHAKKPYKHEEMSTIDLPIISKQSKYVSNSPQRTDESIEDKLPILQLSKSERIMNIKEKIGIKRSGIETQILMNIMKNRHNNIENMLKKHNFLCLTNIRNSVQKETEKINQYKKQLNKIILYKFGCSLMHWKKVHTIVCRIPQFLS